MDYHERSYELLRACQNLVMSLQLVVPAKHWNDIVPEIRLIACAVVRTAQLYGLEGAGIDDMTSEKWQWRIRGSGSLGGDASVQATNIIST